MAAKNGKGIICEAVFNNVDVNNPLHESTLIDMDLDSVDQFCVDQIGGQTRCDLSFEPDEVIVYLQFGVTTKCLKGAILISSLYLCQFNSDFYETSN